MTDEERQRMCADLRRCKSSWLEDVADELERLWRQSQMTDARSKLEQAKQAPEAKKRRFLDIFFFHDECASALRSRAAERSKK
jgi:hypothetical protein